MFTKMDREYDFHDNTKVACRFFLKEHWFALMYNISNKRMCNAVSIFFMLKLIVKAEV